MQTVALITLTALAILFVVSIFCFKQPEYKETKTVWKKLDEHEKALGE